MGEPEKTGIWRAADARQKAREVGYSPGLARAAVLLEEFGGGQFYYLTTRSDMGRLHYLPGRRDVRPV